VGEIERMSHSSPTENFDGLDKSKKATINGLRQSLLGVFEPHMIDRYMFFRGISGKSPVEIIIDGNPDELATLNKDVEDLKSRFKHN
jgi:hypothetical protein